MTLIRALQWDEGKHDPSDGAKGRTWVQSAQGAPLSGPGRRREGDVAFQEGFFFFSLFFKDCVTTVHLYAVQTPFSGERLVIQERKGVRAGAEFTNRKENVILSTGGMGVSRETRWCV